jgi:hypothetical protein
MAEKPLLLAQLEEGTADFLRGFVDMAAAAVAVLRAAEGLRVTAPGVLPLSLLEKFRDACSELEAGMGRVKPLLDEVVAESYGFLREQERRDSEVARQN